MRIRDYISDLFSCDKALMHQWESSYSWSIGDCGRGQAEGHSGWRCFKCGKIRFYDKNYKTGAFEPVSREKLREEATLSITGKKAVD